MAGIPSTVRRNAAEGGPWPEVRGWREDGGNRGELRASAVAIVAADAYFKIKELLHYWLTSYRIALEKERWCRKGAWGGQWMSLVRRESRDEEWDGGDGCTK